MSCYYKVSTVPKVSRWIDLVVVVPKVSMFVFLIVFVSVFVFLFILTLRMVPEVSGFKYLDLHLYLLFCKIDRLL